MNKLRLIQIIKKAGLVDTRAEAMKLIKSGKVKVNGISVTDIYYQTRPNKVTVEGKPINLVEKMVYFLLNKPAGYSCQKTEVPNVLQLFKLGDKKIENMLHPIGRLDVDTTGLLIVTNDGSIMHQILKPEENVWKTYHVVSDKELSSSELEKIRNGITIKMDMEIYRCLPAKIERIKTLTYEVKIKEGKKRQVKRMFEAVNAKVLNLKRVAIGGLVLPDIKEGEYKEVRKEDLEKIFN